MNDLKKVFSFARAYRKDFAIAVALVCIETVFEMIIPLIMTHGSVRSVIDKYINSM